MRAPVPAYERELEFPTLYNSFVECIEEHSHHHKDDLPKHSPVKTEESKSSGDERSINTDCEREEYREGVEHCAGFFTKIPPIDGCSHFENLQSTNWNTLRFKSPPSAESSIGWRVEVRPMDI